MHYLKLEMSCCWLTLLFLCWELFSWRMPPLLWRDILHLCPRHTERKRGKKSMWIGWRTNCPFGGVSHLPPSCFLSLPAPYISHALEVMATHILRHSTIPSLVCFLLCSFLDPTMPLIYQQTWYFYNSSWYIMRTLLGFGFILRWKNSFIITDLALLWW